MTPGIDRLASVTIRAASPDERVQAMLSADGELTVTFRRGCYADLRERSLELQVASLAKAVWAGYRQAYRRIVAEATGQSIDDGPDPDDPVRRRFQEARSRVVATGESPRHTIRVESLAMTEWRVRVADGALARLREEEFLRELNGTFRAVRLDYVTKVVALKDKFYDLNLENKDRWFGRAS